MNRKSLLFLGFGLTALVWLLNYIAIIFYFYWTIAWYDLLMHFLGGLTVAVLIIWLLKIEVRMLKVFLLVFALTMAVGVGWEIFEYVNDLVPPDGYRQDTITDLIMDALGAVVAYFLVTISRSQESTT